jgi:aminoglycoside phosphotransferase (APT) family kinase protein
VFAEAHAPDVVDAVFGHPAPGCWLASSRPGRPTLIHGDLRWANLGLTDDRVVMLDWGSRRPAAALDFAWYLLLNGRRIDLTTTS